MRTRAKKKHAYFQMNWNFDQSTEQFEINLIFRKDFFMDQTYMKKQPVLGLVVQTVDKAPLLRGFVYSLK